MRMFEKNEIAKTLELEVIELAQTAEAFPNVAEPKEDCTLRCSVSSGKRYAVSVPNSYYIPHMDECIHWLRDATFFSTSDATSVYCQLKLPWRQSESRVLHDIWDYFSLLYPVWIECSIGHNSICNGDHFFYSQPAVCVSQVG